MSKDKVTRRRFLKGLAAAAGATALAACTPQVVEKVVDRPVIQTVVVEKAVEVEKIATVIVQKAVEVERKVVQTVVVERPVEIEKRVVQTVVVDRPVVETVIVEKPVISERLVEVEKEVTVIVEKEVAILGVGKTRTIPAFDATGQLVQKQVCNFSWSADHRVIDGATMGRAAEVVRGFVEDPDSMVIHLR